MSEQKLIELRVLELKAADKYATGAARFEPNDLYLQVEVEVEKDELNKTVVTLYQLNKLIEDIRIATHVILKSDEVKENW